MVKKPGRAGFGEKLKAEIVKAEMQEASPSEIQAGLRNDGLNVHHRAELEKLIDRALAKLEEIRNLAREIHEKVEDQK
jgi:hypothetical protein